MKKYLFAVCAAVLLAAGCGPASAPQTGSSVPPADNPQAQPENQPATGPKSYTMAEVNAANSEQKCWTAVEGKVYDLTGFLNKHPGGKQNAMKICGRDGTETFMGKHGQNNQAKNALAGLEIGILAQ